MEVRRSLSRNIPDQVQANSIDLGVVSYKPGNRNLHTTVIYNDAIAFIVHPEHPFAERKQVSIRDLGEETIIAHNIASPYRQIVLDAFQKYQVPLRMDLEMPTVETIKKMVQDRMGVAFVPRMCVQSEAAAGQLVELPCARAPGRPQDPPGLSRAAASSPRRPVLPGTGQNRSAVSANCLGNMGNQRGASGVDEGLEHFHNWCRGFVRARLQPCRKRANKKRALAPEVGLSFRYTPTVKRV